MCDCQKYTDKQREYGYARLADIDHLAHENACKSILDIDMRTACQKEITKGFSRYSDDIMLANTTSAVACIKHFQALSSDIVDEWISIYLKTQIPTAENDTQSPGAGQTPGQTASSPPND